MSPDVSLSSTPATELWGRSVMCNVPMQVSLPFWRLIQVCWCGLEKDAESSAQQEETCLDSSHWQCTIDLLAVNSDVFTLLLV
jgi:hypothetical protein